MVDAVIAGAGIAGVATAWQLAERLGTTTTILVDPHPPLSVTSNRPETNYRDWWPQPAMAELANLSLGLVEAMLADGAAIPMDRRGYLYVSADETRVAAMPSIIADRANQPGHGADLLDRTALRGAYPHLSQALLGGIRVRRAGGIDTVAQGRALLARARARGVSVLEGSVVEVVERAGRVVGVVVETTQGRSRLPTDRFVNAAGPFVRPLVRMVRADLELETVLRQKVVVRDRTGVVPRDAPFTILLDGQTLRWSDAKRRTLARSAEGRRLLEPLPGGIHVKPDDTAGRQAIKLGWAWDQTPARPTESPVCPPEFPAMVLLGAEAVIPGLARILDEDAALMAHEGGFYARTADGQPIVGPLGMEGAYIVGALAGFGAMMAAGSGALAASWLLGDEPTPLMRALAPARFEDPAYRRDLRAGRVETGEL